MSHITFNAANDADWTEFRPAVETTAIETINPVEQEYCDTLPDKCRTGFQFVETDYEPPEESIAPTALKALTLNDLLTGLKKCWNRTKRDAKLFCQFYEECQHQFSMPGITGASRNGVPTLEDAFHQLGWNYAAVYQQYYRYRKAKDAHPNGSIHIGKPKQLTEGTFVSVKVDEEGRCPTKEKNYVVIDRPDVNAGTVKIALPDDKPENARTLPVNSLETDRVATLKDNQLFRDPSNGIVWQFVDHKFSKYSDKTPAVLRAKIAADREAAAKAAEVDKARRIGAREAKQDEKAARRAEAAAKEAKATNDRGSADEDVFFLFAIHQKLGSSMPTRKNFYCSHLGHESRRYSGIGERRIWRGGEWRSGAKVQVDKVTDARRLLC